jgi:acyl carrier protein
VEETGAEECGEQFAAKVAGVQVLERVIGELPLDFCLLFSSLASVLGGLGYTAYAAANQYMDAFARARARDGHFPWTSVGWDAWRFEQPEPGAVPVSQAGMTPGEGIDALARALAFVGVPQVVVSTTDLDARLARWVTAPGAAPDRAKGRGHERPQLSTRFQAPRTPDEQAIAQVWSELLGIDEIGVDDSFFEFGGNSLLATQVTSRLRQTLHVEVPLRAFLQTPTVAGLARVLEAQRAAAPPLEPELPFDGTRSIEDELAEVSNLSDEQVAALIRGAVPSATAEGE